MGCACLVLIVVLLVLVFPVTTCCGRVVGVMVQCVCVRAVWPGRWCSVVVLGGCLVVFDVSEGRRSQSQPQDSRQQKSSTSFKQHLSPTTPKR